MSHVDEGTLHALVDDQLDAAERSAVEAHLATCGECARRFAEATAMARQVMTLLGALDAPMQPVRVVAPASVPVVAPSLEPETTVTPIRRRLSTMRRIAIAASVVLVAGVSYQVGRRGDAAVLEAPARAERAPAPAVSMRSVPGGVDGAADSFVAAPAPSVRAKPGSRADADGLTGGSSATSTASPAAAPPAVIVPPVPLVATVPQGGVARSAQEAASQGARSEVAADERRSRSSDAPSQEQARVQAPEQAQKRAAAPIQMREPSAQRTVSMTQAAPGAPSPVAREVSAMVGASAGNVQGAGPKAVSLAGYTTVEDAAVPAITRRRYVSSAGTTLELSIIQSTVAPKTQDRAAAREFVVTTANGRSSVRWHVSGMDYLLQGPLPPDSLVKLATQLKP